MQVSAFPAIFKADFGRFRPVSAGKYGRFRPFPACFGRQLIRPDFGRISPVRRELKPIWHESSRIGANRAESARIREKKKKKKNADAVRRAGNRVGSGCSTAGAASMLSRITHKKILKKKKVASFNQDIAHDSDLHTSSHPMVPKTDNKLIAAIF